LGGVSLVERVAHLLESAGDRGPVEARTGEFDRQRAEQVEPADGVGRDGEGRPTALRVAVAERFEYTDALPVAVTARR
jgi:hypothetical protein